MNNFVYLYRDEDSELKVVNKESITSISVTKGDFGDGVADGSTQTMVKLEEIRLERMKKRQQKEIQSVIEMEAKMAKIHLLNAQKEAEETRKKNEYQKKLRAKRAQLMANKHARELEKKKTRRLAEKGCRRQHTLSS